MKNLPHPWPGAQLWRGRGCKQYIGPVMMYESSILTYNSYVCNHELALLLEVFAEPIILSCSFTDLPEPYILLGYFIS